MLQCLTHISIPKTTLLVILPYHCKILQRNQVKRFIWDISKEHYTVENIFLGLASSNIAWLSILQSTVVTSSYHAALIKQTFSIVHICVSRNGKFKQQRTQNLYSMYDPSNFRIRNCQEVLWIFHLLNLYSMSMRNLAKKL